MTLLDYFDKAYDAGMLTLAIVFLGLAIIAYPTLRKQAERKHHKKK